MKAFLFDPQTETCESVDVASGVAGIERFAVGPDGSRRTLLFMASGYAPTGEVIFTKKVGCDVGPLFSWPTE